MPPKKLAQRVTSLRVSHYFLNQKYRFGYSVALYPMPALIFFLSLVFGLLLVVGIIFKPKVWRHHLHRIRIFTALWVFPYFVYILFFKGPVDLNKYPARENSPYKLPWQAGVTRVLSQGKSFKFYR
jgi:hypothetical protein